MSDRPTIRNGWDAYRASLPHHSAEERIALRRAYYAGALATLAAILDCGELPEDEGVRVLEQIKAEIRAVCVMARMEVL